MLVLRALSRSLREPGIALMPTSLSLLLPRRTIRECQGLRKCPEPEIQTFRGLSIGYTDDQRLSTECESLCELRNKVGFESVCGLR